MKIGLISDTHLSSGRVPPAIIKALTGVDLILHAGDLTALDVLRHLEAVAPVTAVQGNMDLPGVLLNLPLKAIVEAEGRRIGLIHGHHVPHPDRVLAQPLDFGAMHAYLLSEFRGEGVGCIVYGHTHQAHIATVGNVLLVNPGSATRAKVNSVGLLTVSPDATDAIRAEIVILS
jgi:putative phosphoesterase